MAKHSEDFDVVKEETRLAYADCHMKNEREGYKLRNLDFKASRRLSVQEAYEIFKTYVKGYNEFEPELILVIPEGYQVLIAREGSVCVYVYGDNLNLLNRLQKQLHCDELHVYEEDGEQVCRIWWD